MLGLYIARPPAAGGRGAGVSSSPSSLPATHSATGKARTAPSMSAAARRASSLPVMLSASRRWLDCAAPVSLVTNPPEETPHADRLPARDQEPGIPRRPDARERQGAGQARPRGVDRDGGGC